MASGVRPGTPTPPTTTCMSSMFPVTIARVADALTGDRCGLADFLVECTKECHTRYCRLQAAQVTLRKRIVVGICSRVAVFWEGTLDIDDRWSADGLLTLIGPNALTRGKGAAISGHVKMAMTIKTHNVSGTGVRDPFHLAVGMAAASNDGGKEVKRAAISQDRGQNAPGRKRRRVSSVLSETTCRRLAEHHMWQYFCTFRPFPIQF